MLFTFTLLMNTKCDLKTSEAIAMQSKISVGFCTFKYILTNLEMFLIMFYKTYCFGSWPQTPQCVNVRPTFWIQSVAGFIGFDILSSVPYYFCFEGSSPHWILNGIPKSPFTILLIYTSKISSSFAIFLMRPGGFLCKYILTFPFGSNWTGSSWKQWSCFILLKHFFHALKYFVRKH